MLCKSPTMVKHGNIIYKYPCKKCIPCKINKTSEWQLRLMMELNNPKWNGNAIFLSLTYNNENLPKDLSCHIDEISDYNKALRQEGFEFKFFACSEYGDDPERLTYFGSDLDPELVKRPHYHIIYFGLDNSLKTREILYKHWKKCDAWKFFGKTWYKTVGNVTKDSCSYVAGYCQKKLFGDKALEEYQGKEPPLQRQSKGLGEETFLENYEKYVDDGFILFNGVEHAIPETWRRKYDIKGNSEKFNLALEKRLETFNSINHSKYSAKELWEMFNKSMNISSPFQLIEKSNDEYEAYQEYVEWKNNLKRKRN